MLEKKHTLSLLTLLLCVAFIVLLPAVALATEVGNFSSFTYASYFTADYKVESTTGNASVSGATISLDATGVNATTGCNSTPAVSSTTTVTLTANQTVSVTCSRLDSNITIIPPSEVTDNSDGSKTFTVPAEQSVKFSVTATNATKVSGTVTFSSVEPATSTVPDDCATYSYNDKVYNYLDKVITDATAKGSGTIVVTAGGKVYHSSVETDEDYESKTFSYAIPSGVTFLVPYSASDLTVDSTTETVEGGMNSTLEHANKKLVISNSTDMLMPQNKVTYTLTIPADTTVNVASGGKFVVGGTICCGHDSYIGIIGGTAGDHSNVQLEGILNVSGILSSCGYILGDGQMNVANGGTVYQPFVVMDQRNGQYVVGTTTNDDNVFPWNRYALMNIQCNVHMDYGASMKGYIDAYTAAVLILKERHTVACQTIIGPSGALYNLNGSADISYNASRCVTNDNSNGLYDRVGTTTIEFNGDVTVGALEMTLSVGGRNYSVNSSTDYFPVPYNFQIHQYSGTFTVAQKLKLMPGALLYIHEGAALNVTSKLAVMDSFSDQCDVSQLTTSAEKYARYCYPVAADLMAASFSGTAQLIVDGTMTVESNGAFGGVVQTSGFGTVTMDGTPGLTVIMGPRSQETVAMTAANISGRTVYSLSPRLYVTGENKAIEMETGKTYYGIDGETHTIPDFSYTLYTSASDDSATETITGRALNANVIGTWKCADGSHTDDNPADDICDICGLDYKFEIYGTSIVVADGLDMYFYIEKSHFDEAKSYYAVVTKDFVDGYAGASEPITIDKSAWGSEDVPIENGESIPCYYFCFSDISAKEMKDDITVVIFLDNGTETEPEPIQVSKSFTESVESYAHRTLLKAGDSDSSLKTALVDMLRYGAACQTHFGYDSGNLVTTVVETEAGSKDYAVEYATKVQAKLPGVEGTAMGTGDYFVAASASARNKLVYTFYFDGITESIEKLSATATVTYNGATLNNENVKIFKADKEGVYGVDVELPMMYGRATLYCELNGSSSTAKGRDSLVAYVARLENYDEGSVYDMLLRFVDSAEAYFQT